MSTSARDPVKVTLPATPDGTLKAIAAAFGEGKTEVIWQALPASYQADVKKLLVDFSKKMDADLWAQGNKVTAKVAKLFTDKAEFIVGTQIVAQQLNVISVKPEDLGQSLIGVGGLLAELQSNVATLPQVEKLDVEKLLADLGPRYREFAEAMVRIGKLPPGKNLDDAFNIDVKVVSTSTDNATVEVTKVDSSKETVELVRVEGKWVPKVMADQWASKIADAQKAIDGLQIKPEQKQKAIMLTGIASGMLDGFLNAKTQAEFDASVKALLPLLGGAIPNQK